MLLGWGIIGIGTHSERFLAPAIQNAENGELAAVCSRNMKRATEFADKHGAKRAYDSYAAMLDDSAVDVVYVGTPNWLHPQHTIEAARAGRHVLCEKPMANVEEDCVEMLEVCEEYNVKLGIDYQNRFHPAHVEVRRLLEEGHLGQVKVAKAQYCQGFLKGHWGGWRNDPIKAGSGALSATAVHAIDLLRFVLDSEVETVSGVCPTQTDYHEVDEMVYAILDFACGTFGVVVSGILAPRSDNDLVLYGERAKVKCKGTVGMPLQGTLSVEGDSVNLKMSFPSPVPHFGCYTRIVEAFGASIEDDTEFFSSGENGLQMVRLGCAILRSSEKGKAIRISGD